MSAAIILLLSIHAAILLDYYFAEPKRWHPLVGFGNLANAIEKRFNGIFQQARLTKLMGCLAWCAAVLPWVLFSLWLGHSLAMLPLWLEVLVSGTVLYLAIGWQSLGQHAAAIAQPLAQGDIVSARQALAMMVSRDTKALDATAIATAATESVLENGADAIFAAVFWFVMGCVIGLALAGLVGAGFGHAFSGAIAGVVLYRLSNTLDAMWGYKNDRYRYFGWAAARIDDVLNFIPARLTALSYTLIGCCYGNGGKAWRSWRTQGGQWKSPNAGPVMAAGAGALGVQLGGTAIYHGVTQARPVLGEGTGEGIGKGKGSQPSHTTITAATKLVDGSLALWVIIITLGVLVMRVWL